MKSQAKGRGLLFLIFLLCFLLGLGIRAPKAALIAKIGYIDIQKVFQGYEKTGDREASLKKSQDEQQRNLEKLREEIEKLKDELKEQELILTESAKEERRAEIDRKAGELDNLVRDITEKLEKQREEYTDEIVKDIYAMTKSIAEREGYRLVFHKEALIYATPEPEFDLTEKVLSQLNEKYRPISGSTSFIPPTNQRPAG
jgi:Skp family chaperone for outer membrane proteins